MINSARAHRDTLRWMKGIGDGRFEPSDVDSAINAAITEIINGRNGEGKGEGRISSLTLRSELMPMQRRSCSISEEEVSATYSGTVLLLEAGYAYRVPGTLTNGDDYAKLINAGLQPRLDANGSPVVVNAIPQISDKLTTVTVSSYVTLSSAITIKRSLYPMCTLSNGYVLRSSLEPRFAYLLSLRVKAGGKWYDTTPTTHSELPVLKDNPNTRPDLTSSMPMAYNLEEGLGFKVEAGGATLEGAELLYLPTPVEVFAGKEYDLSTVVKADLVGKRVIVRSEWAIISGTVYDCGDELTIYNDHTLTEGIVAVGYRHSDIPTVLHHEVCRAAAVMLAVGINDNEKIGAMVSASKQS